MGQLVCIPTINGKEVIGEKEVFRTDFLILTGGGSRLISLKNFFVFFS